MPRENICLMRLNRSSLITVYCNGMTIGTAWYMWLFRVVWTALYFYTRFWKILGDYIPAVFSNTGLEFPEIVRFARSAPGEFIEIKPLDKKTGKRITYRDVILRAGYPLVSKETADKLYKLRHGNLSPRYRNYMLNGDERGRFGMLPKKWRFLIEAPFEISGKCCDLLKKGPLKEYEKQTGRKPFIGVTQDEGFRREHQYAKTGCNVYDGSTIKSQSIGILDPPGYTSVYNRKRR